MLIILLLVIISLNWQLLYHVETLLKYLAEYSSTKATIKYKFDKRPQNKMWSTTSTQLTHPATMVLCCACVWVCPSVWVDVPAWLCTRVRVCVRVCVKMCVGVPLSVWCVCVNLCEDGCVNVCSPPQKSSSFVCCTHTHTHLQSTICCSFDLACLYIIVLYYIYPFRFFIQRKY